MNHLFMVRQFLMMRQYPGYFSTNPVNLGVRYLISGGKADALSRQTARYRELFGRLVRRLFMQRVKERPRLYTALL